MGVEVPIEFITSFDKALSGLSDFTKKTESQLGGITSKFGTLGTVIAADAFLDLGKKAAEGLKAVGDAIGHVVSEAAQAQVTLSQVGQALKVSGDFSERNVQAFQDLAEQLSRTSRFDDDVILGQVKLAKQFNTTNAEAAKLISAATDLAAATGQDLGSAVQQLGQTLDGTAGRIGQMIPGLQTLTAEQLTAGAAIDVVAKRFKGFAGTELTTFNGALLETKKAFNDLVKGLGAGIVNNSNFVKIFQAITEALREFTDIIKANQGEIAQFVTGGILIAVQAFGVLAQALKVIVELFSADIKIVRAFGAALTALKNGSLTGVKDAIIAETNAVKDFFAIMNGEKSSGSSKIFDAISESAANLSEKIASLPAITKAVADSTKAAAKGFDNLQTSMKRFGSDNFSKLQALREELKGIGDVKLDQIQNEYDIKFALIEKAYQYEVALDAERLTLEDKLRKKFNQEYFAELQAKTQAIFANPFSSFNQTPNPQGALGVGRSGQTGIATGLGGLNGILGGASGASSLLGSAISAGGTALLGPVGSLLGTIAQQLAKGPEAVQQMVDEFARALPDFIVGLVKAIPTLIAAIIEDIPMIIQGIVDHIPDIIQAFIEGIPRIIGALIVLLPRVIGALVGGASQFVGKILEGGANFVGKILEGAGQFIQKIIEGITQGVGSKNGLFGTGLFNFSGGGFGIGGDKGLLGGGIISGILRQDSRTSDSVSTRRSSGPNELHINLKVGHNEMAKTIVDIKRLGFRLEPI